MGIGVTHDVGEFLAACRSWLVTKPVEHNLILSIAESTLTIGGPSLWAWTTDDRGERAALAQSPIGFRGIVTPLPAPEARRWAEAVGNAGIEVPGIVAEAATAASFAGEWASVRSTGAAPMEAQRVYQFTGDRPVDVSVPGKLRLATMSEVGVLADMWSRADAETSDDRGA